MHRIPASSSNGGDTVEHENVSNVKEDIVDGTGAAVETEGRDQSEPPPATQGTSETADEGTTHALGGAVWGPVGKALMVPVSLLGRIANVEWLRKQWHVPWGPNTAQLVLLGSLFAAGVVGQLSGGILHRVLGPQAAGIELQRFVSRSAAYLTVALIFEFFLTKQKKKLEENPLEMGRTLRWGHLKWVALWFGFRILWGGLAPRGFVPLGMCEPPSAFPIERPDNYLRYLMMKLGLRVSGDAWGVLSADPPLASSLNSLLDVAVAPLFEEAVFRGFLQTSMASRFHPLAAIATTALLQGLSFVAPLCVCGVQPAVLHPRSLILRWGADSALAAVVYGLVFQRTRSLVPVVLLHQLEAVSRLLKVEHVGKALDVSLRFSGAGR